MTKKEYLRRLKRALYGVPKEERDKLLDYYRELIDDGVESGKSEEEVVSELESPEKVAENFREEMPDVPKPAQPSPEKKVLGILGAIIGIFIAFFGAVLLFSLGVSAFSVTLAGTAVFFTSFAVLKTPAVGFAQMGAGLFVCGVGVLLFCVCALIGKLYAYLLKACFSGKQPVKFRKKQFIVTAIVGGGLAFIGVMTFFAGFAAVGFRYEALTFSQDVIEKSEEISDEFDALYFESDDLWIDLEYSSDSQTKIVWYELKGDERSFSYSNGHMTLKSPYHGFNSMTRIFKWGFWFSVLPNNLNRCVLYLPAGFAGSLSCEVENGRLGISDMQFGTLILHTQNGLISLSNISAEKIEAETQNGKVEVISCTAVTLKAESDNGKITVRDCEMEEIVAKTDNGAVMLENSNAKKIQAETDNGAVVLDRAAAEDFYLKTSNGSVNGTIRGSAKEFNIDAQTKNGRCNLSNKNDVPDGKKLYVRTSNGVINLQFTN